MANREPVFMYIAIDRILAGNNIRLEGDVAALAASIEQHGILQPITVTPMPNNHEKVECIFGHRRLAAARKAGLTKVPCLLRPRDAAEIRVLTQLAENRDRRDMTKLEEALVYEKLRKLGMTQTQIAHAVGVHQTHVSQRLILLQYPDCVKNAVHTRKIGLTDALAIPLELAQATDGRTLTAVCRRGGRNVRNWVRRQLAEQEVPVVKKRKAWATLNVDADLLDECAAAAKAADQPIAEWVGVALRAALDGRLERAS